MLVKLGHRRGATLARAQNAATLVVGVVVCCLATSVALASLLLERPLVAAAAAAASSAGDNDNHSGDRHSLASSIGLNTPNLGYVYWRNATQRKLGSVIPWPKHIEQLDGPFDYLAINPANLEFSVQGDQSLKGCAIVSRAIARYINNGWLFDDLKPSDRDDPNLGRRQKMGSLTKVIVVANSDKPQRYDADDGDNDGDDGSTFICESTPHSEMDESYSLEVGLLGRSGEPLARLAAKTSWGLIRGLESLSQLIFNLNSNRNSSSSNFAIGTVRIKDEPRFKHRGFMLDTARHYISMGRILETLDAMAFNKLNVFHWHMVDDQSFPFVSSVYPELSRTTAFRPDLVYTRDQVKQVIQFAADRGIRVLAELDTPGHSYALRSIPNLLTKCYNTTTNQTNGDFGPIDPTKLSSYKSVSKILDEFGQVFPETYFHAGGDEVDYDCWKTNPDINHWLESRNMSGNYQELSNYYIRRLYDLIKHYNKTMLVWEEVFDSGANLPKDAIVHVWKYINNRIAYMSELKQVVSSGYRAILSSCWYLNYIDYGQDWSKFYLCDPVSSPIESQQEAALVLGGEICMWTEFVDDNNVISRTWPRASAAAERLWSPKTITNVDQFLNRLEQHRCRLVYRGIQAEPVNGPGYC